MACMRTSRVGQGSCIVHCALFVPGYIVVSLSYCVVPMIPCDPALGLTSQGPILCLAANGSRACAGSTDCTVGGDGEGGGGGEEVSRS